MGQEIEIRPGIVSKDAEGKANCVPIYSRIVSLFAEQNSLQYAVPGGLIGVGTTVRLLRHVKVFDERVFEEGRSRKLWGTGQYDDWELLIPSGGAPLSCLQVLRAAFLLPPMRG